MTGATIGYARQQVIESSVISADYGDDDDDDDDSIHGKLSQCLLVNCNACKDLQSCFPRDKIL